MTRLITALALASVSFAASAADKPLPVTVTNTVLPVEVSNADPIPVAVSSTETEFRFSTVPTVFSTSTATRTIVTVPAGKALVVDHVSISVNASGPNGLSSVNLNSLVVQDGVNQFAADEIPCSLQGSNALNHFFACAMPTHFYVASGGTLNASINTVDSNGGSYRIFVSGHYVDE